jgi:hypothetical protein
MRILAFVLATISPLLFHPGAAAQTARSIPEPTPLQALAFSPDSRIVWSEEVRQIDSAMSLAVVSAIEVEGADGESLRGVLVELENEDARDAFYIDAEYLRQFMNELAGLEPAWPPGEPPDPCTALNTCMGGVARCRPSQTKPQAVCAEVYTTADSEEGIYLRTPRNHFRFPWIRPSALFAAIAQAIDELKLREEPQAD